MKLKNILDPGGRVFSLSKKENLFGKRKPRTYSPFYLQANHLIIVVAEMIVETSGSCILVLTGDSAFL